MSITYAGVGLTPPNDGLRAFDLYWHQNQIDEFEYSGYFRPQIQILAAPYPPVRKPPRIGVLSWPTGADRYATCHLIATGTQLASLRTTIGTGSISAQTLVIDDGAGGSIETEMYLMPPRPISQRSDGFELYLLTLVDDRYFWWMTGDDGVTDAPSTWGSLIQTLFSYVGVTPSIDSIPAAYLEPDSGRWTLGTQPIPMMIEAAARQVGMRVVRSLDGSVSVVSYSSAAAADTSRWSSIQSLVLAGGRITGADIGRASPASVDVCFFDGTAVSTTLASLGISGYGGVTGVTNKKGRWSADPTSIQSSQKSSYASQAAYDYYAWNLSLTDCTLVAIQDVAVTGLDETVEWVHHQDGMVTRIIRPQWADRNLYGDPPPLSTPTSGSGSGSSGDTTGCSAAVTPASVECDTGVRTLHVWDLATRINSSRQIVLTQCDENEFDLGPCSADNPAGTKLPVAILVCPIKTTINYLDWDSNQRSVSVVTDLRVERKLVTVPVAESVTGCIIPSEIDCCPSGSGSTTICGPDECVSTCSVCSSISAQWDFADPTTGDIILLCWISSPDDGNNCQFVSEDLNWRLYYFAQETVWILQNYATGDFWFRSVGTFDCGGINTMLSGQSIPGDTIDITPVYDCQTTSYNCVNGTCVEVAGDGGTYSTPEVCALLCTTGDNCNYDCSECPGGVPNIWSFSFSDPGSCTNVPTGTIYLSYDPDTNLCRWTFTSLGGTWELFYNSGSSEWWLVSAGGGLIYTISQATWQCNGANVMTKVLDTCGSAETTVNLVPATAVCNCTGCPGAFPPSWQMEIPDNGTCTNLQTGTVTMNFVSEGVGGVCYWTNGTDFPWVLQYVVGTGRFQLLGGTATVIFDDAGAGLFDCTASNVMTKSTDGCGLSFTTVTVNPVF